MKQRLKNTQKGQDLLEFALIFPVLIMMIFLTVDLGRAVYYYSALHNAAREGARFGVVHIPNTTSCGGVAPVSDLQTAAWTRAPGLDPDLTTIAVSCPDEFTLQVQMSYSFLAATPFTEALLGSSMVTLGTQSTMRLER